MLSRYTHATKPDFESSTLSPPGLKLSTAMLIVPLLAGALAACNPGTVPAGPVAGASARPSAGPSVQPSAKPVTVGGVSQGSSQGSQSLGSSSPAASASTVAGSSPSPGSSSTSGSSASPAASASPTDVTVVNEDVYDTAIHLTAPVEARYAYKQRSDFSSLFPTYGFGSGYGGFPYAVPRSSYFPSIFGKIESNTTLKLRFEPKPSRTLLVDLWVESLNYGGLSSSPQPYREISVGENTSFVTAQASEAPIASETSAPTATPGYSQHYQVLVRLNGEIKEFIEPASLIGSSAYAGFYQKQISTYLRPFFSSYSPSTVRLGNSWPARDNLFSDFDTLAGSSGQVRKTRSPSWSMDSSNATSIDLSYRSEVRVTTKDGEEEKLKTFKESATTSIDPSTGLLKKMKSTLSIDGDDKTPYLLELERL